MGHEDQHAASARSSANYFFFEGSGPVTQRWREDDVMRIAARYPRVAVAPLTSLSRNWWDMHIGATTHSWRGVTYAGANDASAKVRVDCTHFCYSLFLWEPVWWALRLVVRAAAEATLVT